MGFASASNSEQVLCISYRVSGGPILHLPTTVYSGIYYSYVPH